MGGTKGKTERIAKYSHARMCVYACAPTTYLIMKPSCATTALAAHRRSGTVLAKKLHQQITPSVRRIATTRGHRDRHALLVVIGVVAECPRGTVVRCLLIRPTSCFQGSVRELLLAPIATNLRIPIVVLGRAPRWFVREARIVEVRRSYPRVLLHVPMKSAKRARNDRDQSCVA